MIEQLKRRRLLVSAAGGLATLAVGGWDGLSSRPWFTRMLDSAEAVDRRVQAFLTPPGAHVRLYTEADISQHFRSNGTHYPSNPEYQALASNDFADWRLELGGLVDHPMSLSLKDIRAMPSITQITRHDCVEGWSCIAKWTGVPLNAVLARLGVQRRAHYVIFFCYDTVPGAS